MQSATSGVISCGQIPRTDDTHISDTGPPCTLAESQIGLYKTELIRPEGPWRDVEHLEVETLDWVDWFNNERIHESIDDMTPKAVEEFHYATRNRLRPTG